MIIYNNIIDGEYGGSKGYDEYEPYEDISVPCKNFSRRRDISVFNMADYRSCENCVHLSPDNKCVSQRGGNFF